MTFYKESPKSLVALIVGVTHYRMLAFCLLNVASMRFVADKLLELLDRLFL